MKKIISSIILVICLSSPAYSGLSSSYSNASTQLILISYPAATLYSDLGMTPISGIYYTIKPDSSTVSPTGDISKPTTAVWIDAADMVPKTKDLNAYVSDTVLRNIVTSPSNEGKYPLLKQTLDGLVQDTISQTAPPGDVGSIGIFGGILYKTTNKFFQSGGGSGSGGTASNLIQTESNGMTFFDRSAGSYQQWIYECVKIGPAPPSLVSNAMHVSRLAGKTEVINPFITSPIATDARYDAEIDKMLQDPMYVPVFTDSTTGLPYSPPPSSEVATPAQVTEHNKNVAVAATSSAAATAAGTAVASGSGSSASYRAAADAAQAAAAANPGDAGLAQKAKDAAAAAAGAKLAEDKLKADQAKIEADKTANNAITAPKSGDAYGSSDTNDYGFGTRFTKFMSDMKSSTLFTLPSTLLGNIPISSKSDFNVSFGRFGSTNFDLANFGSAITLLRSLVLIIFSVVSFKIITLKGGGG